MINLSEYFDPVSIEKPLWGHLADHSCLSHNLRINTDSNPVEALDDHRLAIIGIPDDRRSPNKGCGQAPDAIREQLYQLSRLPGKNRIVDLGNLKKGISFDDSLAGLHDVLNFLLENNVNVLIIGGSSAHIPALDRAMSARKINYTMLSVDSRIDWVNERKEKDSFNYLSDIIKAGNSRLDNFINIGYQSYLNDPQVLNRFRKMNHDLIRIGEVRSDIQEMEPVCRDSEIITFDISSVRQSDAPGTFAPSPNGFYGEEISLLARYAGLSDSLRIFGLFEVNPLLDNRKQTTTLAAQILWFYLEGLSQKQNESVIIDKENSGRFVKYHVSVSDVDEDLIFIKSTVTNRWWIEFDGKDHSKTYIACSYKDYLNANEDEVPQRWMNAVSRR